MAESRVNQPSTLSPLGFRKPSSDKSYFNTNAKIGDQNRISYIELKKQSHPVSGITIKKQLIVELQKHSKPSHASIIKPTSSRNSFVSLMKPTQTNFNPNNMVERSLLRDFVTDKRLFNMFRSEMSHQIQQEQRETKQVQIVSEQMITEQIQRIVNAHQQAMDGLMCKEREVKEKVEEQSEVLVNFKGGLKDEIDESFFAGIIEEMREKIQSEGFKKVTDSSLYLITDDIIETINKMHEVNSTEDFISQVKDLIKCSRVTAACLVQNSDYQSAMIVDLFTKLTLILSDQLLIQTTSEKLNLVESLKQKHQLDKFSSMEYLTHQFNQMKDKLARKKSMCKELTRQNQSLTNRLQVLNEDYFNLQDEMKRLSQARPSDEMSQINVMGRDLELLLNGLSAQRKKTLKGLDTMGRLIDFDSLAHNPAKKKVGTQTDNEFQNGSSLEQSLGTSKVIPEIRLIEPFGHLINLDKALILEMFQEVKTLQTSAELIGPALIKSLVKQPKSDIASVTNSAYTNQISTILRHKLQLDSQCASPYEMISFTQFIVHHFQSQFRVQTQSIKSVVKIIMDAKHNSCDEQSMCAAISVKELCKDKLSRSQQFIIVRLVQELVSRSKPGSGDALQLSFMSAFIFCYWVFNMFAAPSEGEYMLSQFMHNLSYLVKSSIQPESKKKGMKHLPLFSIPKFKKTTLLKSYLQDRKREVQNAFFEIGDFQRAFILPQLSGRLSSVSPGGFKQQIDSQSSSKNVSQSNFYAPTETNEQSKTIDKSSSRSSINARKNEAPTTQGRARGQSLIHKRPINQSLINKTGDDQSPQTTGRRSIVQSKDISMLHIQELIRNVSSTALVKLLLASKLSMDLFQNLYSATQPQQQGYFKKLQQEISQAMLESGKDPQKQHDLTAAEFKLYVLDRHYSLYLSEEDKQAICMAIQIELSDKIRFNSLVDHAKELGILPLTNLQGQLMINGANILTLVLLTFKTLRTTRLSKLRDLLLASQTKEIHLHRRLTQRPPNANSTTTIVSDISQLELNEASLLNYQTFYNILTEANPCLRFYTSRGQEIALKAYKAFMWSVTLNGGGKGGVAKRKETIEREHQMMEEVVTLKVPESMGECEFGVNANGMIQKIANMGSIEEAVKILSGFNSQDAEKEQSPKGGVVKANRRVSVLI